MKGRSSLDVFDFGVLLQALAGSLKVGSLRVVSGAKEKYIGLNRGTIDAIYTTRSRFRLGRILYNMRSLEMETLEEVLAKQRSGELEGPIGRVLVEGGHIEQADLDAALHYQLVEELLEIFYWPDVAYEFYSVSPEEALRDRTARLTRVDGGEDANRILLDVTKIIDDIDKFNQATPSMKDVYEIVGDREKYLAEHEVLDCVIELLDLIDGERDMGEILKVIRLSRLDAMELFYHFKSGGLIRAKNSFELVMLSENRRNSFPAEKRARLYERAAELGAEDHEIALRTAEAYEELEQFEKAADHYLAYARGVEETDKGKDAIAAVAKALELRPERTDILEFRASLLHRQDRKEEAAEDLLRLAGLRREKKAFARAEEALDTALMITPDDEAIRLARIEVIEEAGETRRAAQSCLELALIREQGEEPDGAVEVARRAVGMAPEAIRFRTALANLLTRAERNEEAAEALGGIVPLVVERTKGTPDRALRLLAAIRGRLEDLKARTSEAMEEIATGYLELGKKPEALRVLTDAGEARIALGLLELAESAYRRAAEVAPEDNDLAETLALVQARNGAKEHALARLRGIATRFKEGDRATRAEGVYREMLRIDPFCADAILELARMKTDAGQKREAASDLHRIGDLYKATDNLEEAVEYLDEACRLDPGNPEYVRDLADALGRALKTEKSMETYDALLAMLRARSEHTGVIDLARRMLSHDPDHKIALEAMMDAYSGLGEELRERVKGSAADVG